ncbi:acyl-CoA thioesterase [Flavobacteriaceae bacterium]|nr:acyl-CoA thioesterase [Flavobacteriaceae bacterium]MDC1401913.1 acyl-CoA thioesterase [Flavobacteriaceae bacterium]
MKNKLKMSFLAEPNDANFRGNVHGGKVMKWIDEIGYALSVQYSGHYCVTKFVDDIEFLSPIKIGDLVKLEAEIIKVGFSSMRIKIIVYSKDLFKKTKQLNCECFIVFVALDEKDRKVKVTQLLA